MKRLAQIIAMLLLATVLPGRAELLQVELSVYGMD